MLRKALLSHIYTQEPELLDSPKRTLLERLIIHASTKVPYYKELLHNHQNDIRTLAATPTKLNKLPILEKETIRNRSSDLLANDHDTRKTYWNTSGGSTGIPVRFLQDTDYLKASRYITFQQKLSTGYKIGDPWVKIWGNERETEKGRKTMNGRLIDLAKNLTTLNSFRMSDSDQRVFLETINRKRPNLVVSYVQSIYELAKFAKTNGIGVNSVGAIIVSAGTLYPFMKEEIERVFNAPVFNRYGSRELGNIAISSPENDELAISKGVWVETVNDDGNTVPYGTEGDLVVTSLTNYSMPLIRYRIGDRGILRLKENAEGETMMVLEKITGRTVDVFKTANGEKIDGEYFTHLLYFRDWIRKFQFIQKAVDNITLNLVANNPPPEELDEIELKVKHVMGENCKVVFRYLEDIKTPESGKFRYTISEL